MRGIITVLAIAAILVLGGCGSSGPVWKPGDHNPIVPPPGPNPGGTGYQLQCTIDLSNTVGKAPMPVNMVANVIGGVAPYYYRWDVNGDGWWDYGGIGIYEVGIHYASAGTYKILLEVEDQQGQAYRANALVDVKPSGPSAQPYAFPNVGTAPLLTSLDGSQSFDLDGSIVLYEWDFESDGIWDYESDTVPSTTNTYDFQGTYNATLRVTDTDGLTDVASVQVIAL